MGSLDSDSPCTICQARCNTIHVQHVHLSTAYYNKQMAKKGEQTPLCHFCDTCHIMDNDTRLNVILTTATLSGVQYASGWGWGDQQPTHCDVESIPGGKIVNLKRAWERAYLDNPLPIDTVLVAGTEDILDLWQTYQGKYGMTEMAEIISEVVLDAIEKLHRAVKAHAARKNVDDTLAVCTMVHVPALYWRETDGWFPTGNYQNLKQIIDRTNLKITAFNLKNGTPKAPKLHQAGERGKPNKKVYMWDCFVELKREDMRTLQDQQRIKLARLLVKYFEKGTPKSYKIWL